MWDYLEHIAFVLSNIVKVLRVMPQSEAKLLRRSFTRRYTTSLKQRPTKAPHTKSKPVPFVTGDDGKLLPGVYVICVHFCLWVSFSVIHIHMNTFIKFPPYHYHYHPQACYYTSVIVFFHCWSHTMQHSSTPLWELLTKTGRCRSPVTF